MARRTPVPEGDPRGAPSVHFDRERRQNYTLLADGETRQYHEVPAGCILNGRGVPIPAPRSEETTEDA